VASKSNPFANSTSPFSNTKSPFTGSNPFGTTNTTPKLTLSSFGSSGKRGKATPQSKAALTSIKKNQNIDHPSLWENLIGGLSKGLDYISRPGHMVNNALYDITSGHAGNALSDAWKGLTTTKGHTFQDVLNNFGPNFSQNKGLAFVGDVVTDPLTYLTFGSTGVAKGVLKPFVTRALEEASQKGAVKGTKAFADIWDKHLGSDAAIHALKTAQTKGNNAMISAGLPFGRKLTLVNKPLAMQKQTQKVSTEAASALNDLMSKSGIARPDRLGLISHMIGRTVHSTKDLNTQEFDFVNQIWHNHLGQSAKTHFANLPDPFAGLTKPSNKANSTAWKKFIQTNYSNSLHLLPKPIDQMSKSELVQAAKDLNTNYKQSMLQAVGNVKNDFTKLGKNYTYYDGLTGFSPATKKLFVKPTGEATKLGNMQEQLGKLFGSRRFVPLASQIRDHRIQSGMGHILGSGNKSYAYGYDFINQLKHDVGKMQEFKSLTPDDWKEVAYTIEGNRPTHAGYTPPSPAKQAEIDAVVHKLVGDPNNPAQADSFLKRLNDAENNAGVQRGVQPRYFPHVYNLKHETDFQQLQSELLNMGQRGKQIAAGLKHGLSGFQKGRTEFQTMADLTDALHEAEKTGNTAFLDRYKDVSWNPLEAFGKRAISGMQQIAKKESIDAIVRDGLALNRNKAIPEGWVKVGSEGIPKGSPLEELKGQIVPKEIHSDLMKVNKLFTNDAELNHFMDKADKVLSILRRNYTVTKAGFHIRQSIGNIFQNTLAGVSPAAWSQAGKFLAHPDRYPQWEKELLENGIIHTGTSGADLANSIGDELSNKLSPSRIAKGLNPVSSHFYLATGGRKLGEFEDNMARVSHYFYMRNKGLSQQAATDSVRKYLFNYSEISTTGQAIRRFIPFYQWMRNNLPFQIVNTLKNPKAYNIAQNFLRDFQNQPDNQDAIAQAGIYGQINQDIVQKLIDENGGVLPKYIQDNYINTPLGYYSIGLPVQDVKQMTEDPAKYFFSGMNPYLSLLTEMSSNQNNLNYAPIDKSVPTGQSIWTTPMGMRHVAETAIGSPAQIGGGIYDLLKSKGNDWSSIKKGVGVNTQKMDIQKAINNLLYQKALELNTKAKATRDATANGGN
jgi:hypothetical protein